MYLSLRVFCIVEKGPSRSTVAVEDRGSEAGGRRWLGFHLFSERRLPHGVKSP